MIIRMAGNGKLILEEAEKFVDILLNVKEEKGKQGYYRKQENMINYISRGLAGKEKAK